MNPIVDRLIAIAIAALIGAGGFLYVKALRADLATAENAAHTAQETVGRRDATIVDLQKRQRDAAIALAQLERTRQGIAADLAARKSELETLKRENETVRAWADGALPDDVVRLYASPALTGADNATVRSGDRLHDAGNVATP